MLSDYVQNGMESAKLMWSRVPNSDAEEDGVATDESGGVLRSDNGLSESLDYEVIENLSYRQEQVVN